MRQKFRAYEGAVEDYSKVLQKMPGHAAALSGRGDCLLLLGRLEEALAGALLGTATEAEVLKVARSASLDSAKVDQISEAAYYLGAKHLMQGDRASARIWFERATHGGSKAVIEYALARYDLQRLGQP